VKSVMTTLITALTAKPGAVITSIHEQSADIALGVDKSYEAKLSGSNELTTVPATRA
jgi:S-adenosylmethionine synthetase